VNRFRGEAELAAGDAKHTLVLDINALVLAEDALDADLTELINRLNGKVRLGTVRGMVWAALQHQPQPPNLLRAGEIVGEAGIGAAHTAVMKALSDALPKAEKGKADADPRKATGGTGNGSSAAGAA